MRRRFVSCIRCQIVEETISEQVQYRRGCTSVVSTSAREVARLVSNTGWRLKTAVERMIRRFIIRASARAFLQGFVFHRCFAKPLDAKRENIMNVFKMLDAKRGSGDDENDGQKYENRQDSM